MNSCIDSIGDLVAWADFYTGIHGFVLVIHTYIIENTFAVLESPCQNETVISYK